MQQCGAMKIRHSLLAAPNHSIGSRELGAIEDRRGKARIYGREYRYE